jgi:S-(hydroxymethyl)glutathione dehydrogenase/alcohol dehydrogenase
MILKAAVLERTGYPLVIKELEVPQLTRGQVLVKILYSGVCRSQIMERKGGRGEDKWLPHLLGHEGSGKVIAVGEGVTKVKPSDNVILGWIKGNGIESQTPKYQFQNQIVNAGPVTTFNNYAIISENRLTIKPESLEFDDAVLFGCAIPTGAGMVINEIMPKMESKIIVLGLGGIGFSALMALKAIGIKTVIAVDISEKKLKDAKDLGVTYLYNSLDTNLIEKIEKITGNGADYCIESAGKISTIELGFSLIKKKGGKLIFASHPDNNEKIQLYPHELISGKQIVGSWGGAVIPDIDIPIIHKLFLKEKIHLNSMISKTYELEEINDALDDLENGKTFRPLIKMKH